MTRTRVQQLDDCRAELADYVKFCGRIGRPLTYQEALLRHREQCTENMHDDSRTDPMWRDRLTLLDDLASEEGVA
jgi:hypothetical protein